MSKEDAIEVEASSGREPAAEILSEAKDLTGQVLEGNEQRRRD